MATFNSYVSLPEGIIIFTCWISASHRRSLRWSMSFHSQKMTLTSRTWPSACCWFEMSTEVVSPTVMFANHNRNIMGFNRIQCGFIQFLSVWKLRFFLGKTWQDSFLILVDLLGEADEPCWWTVFVHCSGWRKVPIQIPHDGSTVLLYMVCHGSHQHTLNVSIYTSTMDPSWVLTSRCLQRRLSNLWDCWWNPKPYATHGAGIWIPRFVP